MQNQTGMKNRKQLLVIEGLDGSGKATQAALLSASLSGKGMKVRQVSFPDYQSDSSALVKMYLAGEFGSRPGDVNAYAASTFYAVDRYASFQKDWAEDYAAGIIVADRYTTSNAIHQCAKLERERWDAYLDWLFHFEYKLLGIPEPGMVIYLRVEPELSQRLMTERYQGHEEKKDIHEKDVQYLLRCQEAAAYCAERLGWKTVACSRDGEMRTIEDIQSEIAALVEGLLGTEERDRG